MEDKLIYIGHTKKTFGTQGEIKVEIKERYLEDFAEADFIFLEVQGNQTPYLVENIRFTNALLVKVEDIDSPESAHPLTGKKIYMREGDLRFRASVDLSPKANRYERFEGFMIMDTNTGNIGIIAEVIELPQQMMAIVPYQGTEVLIPLNGKLIKEIREKEKCLIMELPEGLLDLD